MKFLSLIGMAEHRHTGRILPHHHTSFGMLVLVTLVAGVALFGATKNALADPPPVTQSFTVFATVAGPPPSTAPTIDVPTNGQTFSTIPITISGTCQAGLTVKITSNNVFIGSATCVAGDTYSLQADLFLGQNDLVARQYDVVNQSSPPSSTVTVFYKPLSPVTPPVKMKPGKSVKPTPSVNQLIIESPKAYQGVLQRSALTWPFGISGGTAPYAISIDWDDGHTDLISRSDAGTFSASHTYDRPGRFTIIIRASDVSGQQAYLQVVSLVSGLGPAGLSSLRIPPGFFVIWPIYAFVLLLLLAFWLGEKREDRKHAREIEQQMEPGGVV